MVLWPVILARLEFHPVSYTSVGWWRPATCNTSENFYTFPLFPSSSSSTSRCFISWAWSCLQWVISVTWWDKLPAPKLRSHQCTKFIITMFHVQVEGFSSQLLIHHPILSNSCLSNIVQVPRFTVWRSTHLIFKSPFSSGPAIHTNSFNVGQTRSALQDGPWSQGPEASGPDDQEAPSAVISPSWQRSSHFTR